MGKDFGPVSPFYDLLHLDIWYPIAKRIYHFLEIADIIAISRTCRSLANVYHSLLPLEWDVDKVLNRFVSDPRRFRAEMAKNNILVGGSVPLQFCERVVWKDEPLLLYQAERDPDASYPAEYHYETSIEKYLTEVEGFEFTTSTQEPRRMLHLQLVRRGIKNHGWLSTRPRVTITGTHCPPIASVLRYAKSTLLANCFTWNKAYSMYPLTSFVHGNAFTIWSMPRNSEREPLKPHVETYKQRGWDFPLPPEWPRTDKNNSTKSAYRHTRVVGDCYTWTIPFDTKGIEGTPADPDYVIEHAVFSVCRFLPKIHMPDHHLSRHCFTVEPFTSEILKYSYTVGADGWPSWIQKIVTYKTLEELHKLSPVERPATFDRMIEDPSTIEYLIKDIQKPSTWKYCDDEIPRLYKEWKTASCCPQP